MDVKFKPKFWSDIKKLKRNGEVLTLLGKIIRQAEKAASVDEISNFKQLTRYKARCRIKLVIDK